LQNGHFIPITYGEFQFPRNGLSLFPRNVENTELSENIDNCRKINDSINVHFGQQNIYIAENPPDGGFESDQVPVECFGALYPRNVF